MPSQTYKIARITDVLIGRALTTLAEEFGEFKVNVNVMQQSLGTVQFPDQTLAYWQQVLELNGELIDHFSGTLGDIIFRYYRGGQTGEITQKSPVLDDLVIEINGINEVRMQVATRILANFRPVSLPMGVNANDPLVALQAIQTSTFTRLEKQLEDLFAQTIAVREQLDDSVRKKTAELEATFNAKQQDADAEIALQQAKLAEHTNAINRKAEELDDSDNTFARRKIRDGMLNDVTTRVSNFGVSETTRQARRPVMMGMCILILVFMGLMAFTLAELSHVGAESTSAAFSALLKSQKVANPALASSATEVAGIELETARMHDVFTERIALWIRLSLLTVGLVGSLIYYIRWQSRWAEQFASTEQSLKQFHLDVNRANWVVETCLEWRKETDSIIPTPLIESLTRGLFTLEAQMPQAIHPADELASALMGSASKLSLAVGENKLEFDKPSKIPKVVSATK